MQLRELYVRVRQSRYANLSCLPCDPVLTHDLKKGRIELLEYERTTFSMGNIFPLFHSPCFSKYYDENDTCPSYKSIRTYKSEVRLPLMRRIDERYVCQTRGPRKVSVGRRG